MTNKTNIETWFRFGITLIGSIAIWRGADLLDPSIRMLARLPEGTWDFWEMFSSLTGMITTPTLLVIGGYLLLRNCQRISDKACNSPETTVPYWEYAGYKLVFMLCGILIISWAVPRIGQTFHYSIANDQTTENTYTDVKHSAWITILWLSIKCGAGLYLILASPTIIKWQIKPDTDYEKNDNTDKWLSIGVILVGLVTLLRGVESSNNFFNTLFSFLKDGIGYRELSWVLIGTIIAPGILLFSGFFLIRHYKSLSTKMGTPPENAAHHWEYAVYRLGFILCGILVLSRSLPRLGQIFLNFAVAASPENPVAADARQSAWIGLVWLFVQCGIGIYLIFASKNIVRWQIKRGSHCIMSDTAETG